MPGKGSSHAVRLEAAWEVHADGLPVPIVAEIPKRFQVAVEKSEIDFAKFEHFQPKTTADLVRHFDENMSGARKALENASDKELSGPFQLKFEGKVLVMSPRATPSGATSITWCITGASSPSTCA